MRVTIVGASKKEEPLHEAPLAATVVTHDEIRASGATSIAEALRLAPGLLVREYVSGGHDIHIRGFSGIPPKGDFANWTNTLTLVMVDGRVSYNYYDGGTFWEALPVAISDVERIEIVAGPAAALYGPNAVTGVINIITRRPSQPGLRVTGRTSTGVRGVGVARLRVGMAQAESAVEYQQDNLSGRLSLYAQENQRTWDKYYAWFDDGYIDAADERSSFGVVFGRESVAYRHPEPSLAVRRLGANATASWKLDEDVRLRGMFGAQRSRIQEPREYDNFVQLTTADSDGAYGDLELSAGALRARTYYLGSHRHTHLLRSADFFNYESRVLMTTVDYDKQWRALRLRPGVALLSASYRGRFTKNSDLETLRLTGYAASMQGEYGWQALRAVVAGRVDKYGHSGQYHPGYHLGATYSLATSHLLRFMIARASKAPFVVDSMKGAQRGNYLFTTPTELPTGTLAGTDVRRNPNLEPVRVDALELGYRARSGGSFDASLDFFVARTRNYSYFGNTDVTEGQLREDPETGYLYRLLGYDNLPTEAQMLGGAVRLSFAPNARVFLRGHVTVQRTVLKDVVESDFVNTEPDAWKVRASVRHRATPTAFGGFDLRYRILPALWVTATPYWFTGFTNTHDEFADTIDAALWLNGALVHELSQGFHLSASIRNIALFGRRKQLGMMDRVHPEAVLILELN
jgi:iron complex outermembrane receptor protein